MDELQISGKRFISSRRIARENGYTSDYIGQLIRGGKITGQKVGRAWYVEAASFDKYLGGEGAVLPAIEEAPEEEVVAAPASSKNAAATREPILKVVEEETTSDVAEEEITVVPIAVKKEVAPELKETIQVEAPVTEVVEEKIVQEEARRIPLHIAKKEQVVAAPQSGGLKYYADDEPLLPEIARTPIVSRMPTQEVSDVHAKRSAFTPARAPRRSTAAIAAMTVLAIAIFAISAVVSSALSLNLSIEAGNSATAIYSFK